MDHTCGISKGEEDYIWDVRRLWELSRDLPVQEVPVESLRHLLEESYGWVGEGTSAWEVTKQAKHDMTPEI